MLISVHPHSLTHLMLGLLVGPQNVSPVVANAQILLWLLHFILRNNLTFNMHLIRGQTSFQYLSRMRVY